MEIAVPTACTVSGLILKMTQPSSVQKMPHVAAHPSRFRSSPGATGAHRQTIKTVVATAGTANGPGKPTQRTQIKLGAVARTGGEPKKLFKRHYEEILVAFNE